jgi:hypothetical protein
MGLKQYTRLMAISPERINERALPHTRTLTVTQLVCQTVCHYLTFNHPVIQKAIDNRTKSYGRACDMDYNIRIVSLVKYPQSFFIPICCISYVDHIHMLKTKYRE